MVLERDAAVSLKALYRQLSRKLFHLVHLAKLTRDTHVPRTACVWRRHLSEDGASASSG